MPCIIPGALSSVFIPPEKSVSKGLDPLYWRTLETRLHCLLRGDSGYTSHWGSSQLVLSEGLARRVRRGLAGGLLYLDQQVLQEEASLLQITEVTS